MFLSYGVRRTPYDTRTLYDAQVAGELNRDRVVAAGLAVADRKGVAAVSMRTLAKALGVGAMSLYHYFESKDALLDAMVDVVYGEMELPPSGSDWRSALRTVAISTRTTLSRHRWALSVLESRTSPGPANLRHHDAVLGCLRDAGFSLLTATYAYSTLDSYVYGFVLQEAQLPFDSPEELAAVADAMLAELPAEAYPNLAATIVELRDSGYAFGQSFEIGLDLVLDGLERLLDAPDR